MSSTPGGEKHPLLPVEKDVEHFQRRRGTPLTSGGKGCRALPAEKEHTPYSRWKRMPSTPGGEGEHPLFPVEKDAAHSQRRRRMPLTPVDRLGKWGRRSPDWKFWTRLPLRNRRPPFIPVAVLPLRAGGGFAAARTKAARA